MNIFLLLLIVLLSLGFLCATLIIAATISSSRSVKTLAQKHPAIYGEEALAKAHMLAKASKKQSTVGTDSTQVMVP